MRIAIMQPYFAPYIGYFQLVAASDVFVFYDDVNFIKRGWIHRNRVLLNGGSQNITVSCIKPSQNKLICDTVVANPEIWLDKLLNTLYHAYSKSPFFQPVYALVENTLRTNDSETISELNIRSTLAICQYIGLKKRWRVSSVDYPDTKGMNREDRLIEICKQEGITQYVNAIGGMDIYDKPYFRERGIDLNFLKPILNPYPQNSEPFVSGLSIIDIIMNHPPKFVRSQLMEFEMV